SVFLDFFFQAEDGIRDSSVTGVQTCALPILLSCGVKIYMDGSGARATRAIHVNLYSTGEQAVVAETRRHARNSRDLGQRFARGRSEERRVGKEWGWRSGVWSEKSKSEMKGAV